MFGRTGLIGFKHPNLCARLARKRSDLSIAVRVLNPARWAPAGEFLGDSDAIAAFWELYRCADPNFTRDPNNLSQFKAGDTFTIAFGPPRDQTDLDRP